MASDLTNPMTDPKPLQRLAPWPHGLLGDFGAAVDQVLAAEAAEDSSENSKGVWWRRRHTKELGQKALKLQQLVGRYFVELEIQLLEAAARELDAVVPVAFEVSALQLRELADPAQWDINCSLLQDVGSFRAGWFLLGGEALGGKLCKLRGAKQQAALSRLDEMSRWYIPNKTAEFQCSLAVGLPILDATCHQVRLFEAWVEREELRTASEQWCSRSFATAMLAVSTSQEQRRQRDARASQGQPLLLPAHYEDPPPLVRFWTPPKQQLVGQKAASVPRGVGGSKAQNVAFWLGPKVPAPPAPPPPPGIPRPPSAPPPPPPQ